MVLRIENMWKHTHVRYFSTFFATFVRCGFWIKLSVWVHALCWKESFSCLNFSNSHKDQRQSHCATTHFISHVLNKLCSFDWRSVSFHLSLICDYVFICFPVTSVAFYNNSLFTVGAVCCYAKLWLGIRLPVIWRRCCSVISTCLIFQKNLCSVHSGSCLLNFVFDRNYCILCGREFLRKRWSLVVLLVACVFWRGRAHQPHAHLFNFKSQLSFHQRRLVSLLWTASDWLSIWSTARISLGMVTRSRWWLSQTMRLVATVC